MPRRINGRVSEYIDYTEPGENGHSWFWVGFVISLFSSVGSYYTYGVPPPYSVFDEYPGLRRVLWVVHLSCDVSDVLCVSLHPTLIMIRSL